jgi:hypothetical protein
MKTEEESDLSWRSGWQFPVMLFAAIPTLINAAWSILWAGLLGLSMLFRGLGGHLGLVLIVLAGMGSWAMVALICAVWVRREDWVAKGGLWVGLGFLTWFIGSYFCDVATVTGYAFPIENRFPVHLVMGWLLVAFLLIRPVLSGPLGSRLRSAVLKYRIVLKARIGR